MTRSPDSDGRAARVSEERLRELHRLHAEAVANKGGAFEIDTDEAFRLAMMEHAPALLNELLARRASAPAAALVPGRLNMHSFIETRKTDREGVYRDVTMWAVRDHTGRHVAHFFRENEAASFVALHNAAQADPPPSEAAGAGAVWQPIETAPKDGTQVLGWEPAFYQGKGGHVLALWLPGSWFCSRAFKIKPTHWMPLPSGPAQQKEAGDA